MADAWVYVPEEKTLIRSDGLLRIGLTSGCEVTGIDGDKPILNITTDATLNLQIQPFIKKKDDEVLITWALSQNGAPGLISVSLRFDAGADIDLTTDAVLQILRAARSEVSKTVQVFSTSIFDLPLLRHSDKIDVLGPLEITLGKSEYSANAGKPIIRFDDARASLGRTNLKIVDFQIDCNTFSVKADSLKAEFESDFALLADDNSPLTLILLKDTEIEFSLISDSPELRFSKSNSSSPMVAIVPGVEKYEDVLNGQATDRLVFDVFGIGDSKLTINSTGLTAKARLRMRPLNLGGGAIQDCRIVKGEMTFRDSLFEVDVEATAKLPYFQNSNGNLKIRSSSSGAFSSVWQMTAGKSWTDPTGNFVVHEPSAAITIAFSYGTWSVNGRIGGQLQFIGLERLEGAAKEWLSDFGDSLRLKFADLDLSELKDAVLPEDGIELNLIGLPDNLDLWQILDFKPDTFFLYDRGFGIGGIVGLKGSESGLSFHGRMPNLRCQIKDDGKIELDFANAGPLRFSGKLSTPGGVSVALDLRREKTARSEELQGVGAVSIPSMPPIAITCILGQRKSKDGSSRDPVFLLYSEMNYTVPLFSGVVLRKIGLGFGINKVLKVVEDTPYEDLVTQLVKGPTGWPNPADLDSWTTPNTDDLDLSLIANTYIAPTPGGDDNQPFPYVGNATLYARPTSDFVILLGVNLWLATSLKDAAENPEFRQHPAATGAMALFPRHGYMELQVRTKQGSKMTEEKIELIRNGLDAVAGELYLRATRDEFLFRVGPLQSETTLAGVTLRGQVVFATYVGQNRAIALLQGNLEGTVESNAQVQLRFGPLTVTAGFRFAGKIAFEAVMAGGYLDEALGLALYQKVRVYAALSVTAWAEVAFRLVIETWFFTTTISWSQSYSASLEVSVDIGLEVLVGRQSALYGYAKVNVSLFGYSFSPSFQIGSDNTALGTAREEFAKFLPKKPA